MKNKSARAWLVMIGCCVTSFFGMGLVINTADLYVVVGGIYDSSGSFSGPFTLGGILFCICVPAILLAQGIRNKQNAQKTLLDEAIEGRGTVTVI